MHNSDPQESSPAEFRRRLRWRWFLASIFALTLIVGLWRARRTRQNIDEPLATADRASAIGSKDASMTEPVRRKRERFERFGPGPELTAEQVVTLKVAQFGRNRRELVRGIGRRLQKEVPPEIEKFFDAVESGKWEEINAQWDALAKGSGQFESSTRHREELDPFWPAVLDAYGVAEQAHLWPAQKLLDYGNAILDSLRPGMVYVGGTDNGRWIPELLNETGEGEQHIIVTQNALADGRYVDFVKTLYGERMTTLTSEDSQGIFQEYIADAQKRLEHDQQFPDEPKQLRQGEDIHVVDGKVQVSGQVAVMAINERLLQTLMQKNPDLSFAIQESFPFKGTYADALPLGPLMELRARNEQNSFTAERAGQSLDYWRNTAQQ